MNTNINDAPEDSALACTLTADVGTPEILANLLFDLTNSTILNTNYYDNYIYIFRVTMMGHQMFLPPFLLLYSLLQISHLYTSISQVFSV